MTESEFLFKAENLAYKKRLQDVCFNDIYGAVKCISMGAKSDLGKYQKDSDKLVQISLNNMNEHLKKLRTNENLYKYVLKDTKILTNKANNYKRDLLSTKIKYSDVDYETLLLIRNDFSNLCNPRIKSILKHFGICQSTYRRKTQVNISKAQ